MTKNELLGFFPDWGFNLCKYSTWKQPHGLKGFSSGDDGTQSLEPERLRVQMGVIVLWPIYAPGNIEELSGQLFLSQRFSD